MKCEKTEVDVDGEEKKRGRQSKRMVQKQCYTDFHSLVRVLQNKRLQERQAGLLTNGTTK